MTEKEFNQKYEQFLERFDEQMDTRENHESIIDNYVANQPGFDPDNDLETMMAYERMYQKIRTNRLVKAAIKEFILENN